MGAVQRRAGGVSFTHPLLRTTALDLAAPELIVEVAVELLDQLDDVSGSVTGAGTLVRLSAAAQRSGASRHRELVTLAYHEAIDHGSWSAAGDLAEQLVETAADLPERAVWMQRLGTARFNELDRDEATARLIDAADLYESCADAAPADAAAPFRNGRAECLLLAMRTDFTRSGQRRYPQLDEAGGEIDRRRVDRPSLACAARPPSSRRCPGPRRRHDRRGELIESAEALLQESTNR